MVESMMIAFSWGGYLFDGFGGAVNYLQLVDHIVYDGRGGDGGGIGGRASLLTAIV